ncbi:MAG: GntR family transcriptional regulator [Anaerolineaceae bacterium]|nr:MAG: GntR family transcriptional regulator [Anaerolineaceae bacterium]
MPRTQTLAEIVADVLRRSLRDGVYLPGEKLIESAIARELSVSQNTARDALRILEMEGWLSRRPRYGLTVADFDSEEAQTLYAIRGMLEKLALEWAWGRMTERDKADLAAIIAEGRIQAGMSNERGVRETITAFHERLLSLAGADQLARVLQPLINQTRLLVNLRAHHDPTDDAANRLTAYGELVTHIRYNDQPAANKLLQQILLDECRAVQTTLDLVR